MKYPPNPPMAKIEGGKGAKTPVEAVPAVKRQMAVKAVWLILLLCIGCASPKVTRNLQIRVSEDGSTVIFKNPGPERLLDLRFDVEMRLNDRLIDIIQLSKCDQLEPGKEIVSRRLPGTVTWLALWGTAKLGNGTNAIPCKLKGSWGDQIPRITPRRIRTINR